VRTVGALLVLAVGGFAAATAVADTTALPPVPTVTVPVPVTLPTTTTPSLPLPTSTVPLPTSTTLPSTPVVTTAAKQTTVSTVTAQPSTTAASSASGSSSAGPASGGTGTHPETAGTSASAAGSASSPPQVERSASSAPWIGTTGPKRRRTATFSFVLPRRQRVIFTVTQVAPLCRAVGRFSVAGHAGLNRVRFAGRVHRRLLPAGTYRILVRTASGRVLRQVTLVVVAGGAPSRAELQAARAANVCPVSAGPASATSLSGLAPWPPPAAAIQQPSVQTGGVATPSPNVHSGVLGSTAEKAAQVIRRPYLIVLLALAIVLLGAASVPDVVVPDPKVGHLLSRHRLELASLGTAILVGVAIALLR
jgi:hypothetical protein